jgi:hypothetical protein
MKSELIAIWVIVGLVLVEWMLLPSLDLSEQRQCQPNNCPVLGKPFNA